MIHLSLINDQKYKGIILFAMLILQPLLYGQDSKSIPKHPADDLPPYIRIASGFGERPDWSHDSQFILFVDKPMGEVYELEVKTGIIRPKTRHFNHYGFTRAMYLANGDILLSGPNEPFDPTNISERERARDMCWLSIMEKKNLFR